MNALLSCVHVLDLLERQEMVEFIEDDDGEMIISTVRGEPLVPMVSKFEFEDEAMDVIHSTEAIPGCSENAQPAACDDLHLQNQSLEGEIDNHVIHSTGSIASCNEIAEQSLAVEINSPFSGNEPFETQVKKNQLFICKKKMLIFT